MKGDIKIKGIRLKDKGIKIKGDHLKDIRIKGTPLKTKGGHLKDQDIFNNLEDTVHK